MRDGDAFFELLRTYVPLLPIQCVWIAGIVLALVRWGKHPNVSLLAFLAYGAYLVLSLLNPLVWRHVFSPLAGRVDDPHQMQIMFAAFNFAWYCVSAIPAALLLAAIYGWRRPAAPSPFAPASVGWQGRRV